MILARTVLVRAYHDLGGFEGVLGPGSATSEMIAVYYAHGRRIVA